MEQKTMAFIGSDMPQDDLTKTKYILFLTLLLIGAIIVLDLSTLTSVILVADIGLIGGGLILVRPEIEKAIKKSYDWELLRKDPPLNWLNNSIRIFFLSLFASFAYLIMVSFNFGIGMIPFGSNYMLAFSLTFFAFGLILLFRISEFIHAPNSERNMLISKIIYWFAQIVIRVGFIGFFIIIQVFNGLSFYFILLSLVKHITLLGVLYNSTVVLSFIAVFPITWNIIFHLTKQTQRKDLALIIIWCLPWIVLAVAGFLLRMGFKPF
jgi:hypothetical protein